ncbi:MAG: DUF4157 domain-containing protein [Pseudomonadota bacterium]
MRPQLQPGLIQRAATLGKRDDTYEREAERIAARVANRTDAPEAVVATAPDNTVQRFSETDTEAERPGEYLVQPTREGGASDDPSPRPGFFRRLVNLCLGGRALPDPVRTDMEGQIGEPFDDVRIHTGPEADALTHEIGARAFTVGRDVVFADGTFQPDTHSGRHLIAHELTHVVQQRGPQSAGAVAQTAPGSVQRDASDYIPDIIPDIPGPMDLVRRYAPRLAPIIDQGPLNWLRDQLGGVFSGVIDRVKALDPGKHVDTLIETFGTLVKSASEIITALISGDCGPMMNALGRMKAAVLEVAGKAWDKIKEFFEPVGEFFADLWASVSAAGSAAIDWIKDFAGDIWDTVEGIGEYIWDKTKPIRDLSETAWDWISEQLFGPSDASAGGDENGIVGWFSDKAMEAWDWIKDQTRPVWEPVSEAVETVNELIPPAFVADLGEKMTSFADDVESTTEELDQGSSVAENREALQGILPSLDEIITTVRGVIVGAGEFLTNAITTVSSKVTTFMTRLRSNSVVSMLAGALSWLETAIDNVSSWVSDKVAKLFEWYVKAFDFLSPFVKQLIEIVGKVVDIALDVMQLPLMLATGAWELIPECIREPIKAFVIDTVLGQIPVFNQLLKLGNLWAKVQETALQILVSIFKEGDILGAAWTFFREMLALIGLPARLVVGILAKAARAYGMILKNPIGFLINLLKAMKEGFQLFFDNILRHLMNGVVAWLTGAVSAAGLKFPTELTFQAVLEFVLSILDITVERVLARLEKKIGKDKVDKIRKALKFAEGVWEFVRVIIDEGITGLWRFIKEKLSNLWTMVLQSTIGWIVEKIITEATIKIIGMLDPTGIMLVINSCIAIYRAIETFVEQLKAMLEIVSRVLDGVVGIASGAIEAAAGFLEKAMADSLPVAIAFLADQVGLGDLSDRIREFVEGVREMVDSAIDWVIDKAIKLGQGFLQLVESGVDLAKAGVAALKEWWRARTSFKTESGEEHSIYIDGQGANAKVILRSDPVTYSQWIAQKSNFTLDTADKTKAYDKAVAKSAELDATIAKAGSAPVNATDDTASDADTGPKIQKLIDELGTLTAEFMPGSATKAEASSPPIWGPKHEEDYGTTATVARLTNTVPEGGSPTSGLSHDNWSVLLRRANSQGSDASFYIQGHILNDNLGGPGNDWKNLTPLSRSANALHEKRFESEVKAKVIPKAGTSTDPSAVNFVCSANYGRSVNETLARTFEDQTTTHTQGLNKDNAETIAKIIRAEAEVPLSMDCSARLLDNDGRPGAQLVKYRVDNNLGQGVESEYHVRDGSDPLPKRETGTITQKDLMAVPGIGEKTAKAFVKARTERSAGITTKKILRNLSLDGKTVLSQGQYDSLFATYRMIFK